MIDGNKCCCTCDHCLRVKDKRGFVKRNECAIDGHYIGYVETFMRYCDEWKKRKNKGD